MRSWWREIANIAPHEGSAQSCNNILPNQSWFSKPTLPSYFLFGLIHKKEKTAQAFNNSLFQTKALRAIGFSKACQL